MHFFVCATVGTVECASLTGTVAVVGTGIVPSLDGVWSSAGKTNAVASQQAKDWASSGTGSSKAHNT